MVEQAIIAAYCLDAADYHDKLNSEYIIKIIKVRVSQ
jgi:hypothetical protein